MEHINSTRRREAFTLAEVVVASGVLGMVMAAFFACLGSGLQIINTARQNLRATQILTQKTEAVRLCTWSELGQLPVSFQDYYYASGSTNGTPSVTYYGTISISPASFIPSSVTYYTNVTMVTVSLSWTNYLGNHPIVHQRQMQTLAAYYGLVDYIIGTQDQ